MIQINEYPDSRITLSLFDRLDVDATDDSGSTWESQHLTYGNLLTNINTSLFGIGGINNTVAKFTPDGTTLGDSSITDDGVNIAIFGAISPTAAVNINSTGLTSILSLRHSGSSKLVVNKTLGMTITDQLTVGGVSAATTNDQIKVVPNGAAINSLLIRNIGDSANQFVIDATTGQMTSLGLNYPTVDGSANQVIETDGAGNLSFVNGGGLSEGDVVSGTTTERVPFINNSNEFTTDDNLRYNSTVLSLVDGTTSGVLIGQGGSVSINRDGTTNRLFFNAGSLGNNQLIQGTGRIQIKEISNNFHVGIDNNGFKIYDSASGTSSISATCHVEGTGATSGTTTFKVTNITPTTIFEINDGQEIGFFNTTPAGQQTITGSRAGNAALADLLTKLATYGIIIDSTS